MKRSIIFLVLLSMVFNHLSAQHNPFKWTRLPSNSEIKKALKELKSSLGGVISVNGKVVDNKTVIFSPVIKLHVKNKAGKVAPEDISRAIVFVEVHGIGGISKAEYSLIQPGETFAFAKLSNGFQQSTLKKQYKNYISYLNSKNDAGLAPGFAPAISGQTSNDNNSNYGDKVYEDDEDEDEDNSLLTIIIGALTLGAILAARSRIKKRKKKAEKSPEKKKKRKEEAEYILQINKSSFSLSVNKPQTLTAKVWKITEKDKSVVSADITIQNTEKQLKISPDSTNGVLNSQLLLKDRPDKSEFNIRVSATVKGHTKHKDIRIIAGGEMKIVVETYPDNSKSLRPDTGQILSCYAKVVDENGENVDELSKAIHFDGTLSDWLDLSDPVWDDDGWIAINFRASNPEPTAISSHPPKIATLGISVDFKENNQDKRLENNLDINLLDCILDTDIESVSFLATGKEQTVEFNAFIQDCNETKDWQFEAKYMLNADTVDPKPLSNISIEPVSDKKVKITLTGPVNLPDEQEAFVQKTLVIYARQKDEDPLERHLKVMVTQEGLFIEKGVNASNELSFVADKNVQKELIFSLYKFNERTREIEVDKIGLQKMNVELLSTDTKVENLVSVLQPNFGFDTLISTIPQARYLLTTQEEIPGAGEIIKVKYRISVPIDTQNENSESFYQDITLNVQTLNVGRTMPTWDEAYDNCKYVIDHYVPEGPTRQKITEILEKQKVFLDVDGLVELRKRIWKVAYNLILTEGAEGYKNVDAWASRIVETLEWVEWAGDLAFNALVSFYMSRFGKAGQVGAVAINMAKSEIIEAINFYLYEDQPIEVFIDRQYDKILPLLMDVTKGHAVSVENIETFVTKNKVLAWTIFIAAEFAYNLYQTKSMIKAAKLTARQLRDELIIRYMTKQLHIRAMKYKVNNTNVESVIDDIKKSLKGTGEDKYVSKRKVLEYMRDPAKVRTLKEHAPDWLKKAFDTTRNKIYEQHDSQLIKHIAEKYHLNPKDIRIDDFRTPGTADGGYNMNTDRDYRVLRKVKTINGETIEIEVHRDRWLGDSQKIFGELTGKPSTVSAKDWADAHQQRGTDRFDAEACPDYSDHIFDKETGTYKKIEPNIQKVERGEGKLLNAEALGKMYENKVKNALEPGTVPEAFAQAKKGVKTLEEVMHGYKKMNLDTPEIPKKLKKAMEIIKETKTDVRTNEKTLAETMKKLKELEYNDISDVMKDMTDKFKYLGTNN